MSDWFIPDKIGGTLQWRHNGRDSVSNYSPVTVNSLHQWPVMRKMFHSMMSSWFYNNAYVLLYKKIWYWYAKFMIKIQNLPKIICDPSPTFIKLDQIDPVDQIDLNAEMSLCDVSVVEEITLAVEGLNGPGPWFSINILSDHFWKSHYGDKTIVRSFYLHNGISYTKSEHRLPAQGVPFNSIHSVRIKCILK